jgi:replicative DNA helicase
MLEAPIFAAGDSKDERVILGCIFVDDAQGGVLWMQYGAIISPEWFVDPANRVVLDAVAAIHDDGGIATTISVVQWVMSKGLSNVCNPAVVMEIAASAVMPRVELPYHLKRVIESYAARLLAQHGARAAAGQIDNVIVEIDNLRRLADNLAALTASGAKSSEDCSARGLALRFQERASNWALKRQRYGWPTGLRGLENYHLRVYEGQRLLIGGEPNVGKSTFSSQIVLNLAEHFRTASEKHNKVGVISLEDGADRWTDRAISNLSGVPLSLIRDGNMSQSRDMPRLMQGIQRFIHFPLIVREFGNLTTERLGMIAREMAQDGCKVIVIDYLQLLRGSRAMESRDRVSEAISMIQGLAVELKVAMIVISALRKLDGRTPTMDDFKETGDIAYAATEIIALSENERGDDSRATEISAHILKQKDGPKGIANFWLRGQIFRFEDPVVQTTTP